MLRGAQLSGLRYAGGFHPFSKGYVLHDGDRQSPLGSRVTIFLRLRVCRRLHLLGLAPMPCDSRVLFADARETSLIAK